MIDKRSFKFLLSETEISAFFILFIIVSIPLYIHSIRMNFILLVTQLYLYNFGFTSYIVE